MDEPIEEIYFNWLYLKVASVAVPTPSLTYWTLFRDLHSVEFVWLLTGDDNRAEDGLDVRKQFLREARLDQDPPWLSIGCSVLEMLIAFSERASFETEISSRDWFWIFLENLNLSELNDASSRVTDKAYHIINKFVWRDYEYSGQGGLFPLRNPRRDQRKLEIWYQFCDYLIDRDIF